MLTLPNKSKLKSLLGWILASIISVFMFLLFESWLIVAPKILGLFGSILVIGFITTCMAWFSTYMLTNSSLGGFLQEWTKEKEKEMSVKSKKYLKNGKILAIIAVDLTLGPIFVPFLFFTLGIKSKKIYFYSIICGYLFSAVWCSIYAGVWWGILKIIHIFFAGGVN